MCRLSNSPPPGRSLPAIFREEHGNGCETQQGTVPGGSGMVGSREGVGRSTELPERIVRRIADVEAPAIGRQVAFLVPTDGSPTHRIRRIRSSYPRGRAPSRCRRSLPGFEAEWAAAGHVVDRLESAGWATGSVGYPSELRRGRVGYPRVREVCSRGQSRARQPRCSPCWERVCLTFRRALRACRPQLTGRLWSVRSAG